MSEQIREHEEQPIETQDIPIAENDTQKIDAPIVEDSNDTQEHIKPKFTKKKLIILGGILVAAIIAAIVLIPSKFDTVKNECVQIAGQISGGKDYFTIDTYPDIYESMDETMKALLLPGAQENALEAIKYANEELGFNGSIYSQMLNTSALMGRQTEETSKYKVSWSYHPDNGLEVTYTKK